MRNLIGAGPLEWMQSFVEGGWLLVAAGLLLCYAIYVVVFPAAGKSGRDREP